MMPICEMTALEIASAIRERRLTSQEVVRYFLDRIEKYDGRLNSFITVCKTEALKQAENVDEMMRQGNISSPLMGVPVAVKDSILTENIKTTAASEMLRDYMPIYDATVVERIKDAGMIVMGKTNMDEFAMGVSNETSAFGAVSNPHNLNRVPGGSSGGSAAAVCAGLIPIALGSDTGGSIRQPASYCGVTGYKPSYGTVSRYGLIAFASSLDQIGVIGKNAADCSALINIISGCDGKDMTLRSFSLDSEFEIRGKSIGVPNQFLSKRVSDRAEESFSKLIERIRNAGASVEFFDMPILKYSVPIYHIISCAEASSNLARYDGVRYGSRAKEYSDTADMYRKTRTQGFGTEVKRRIMTGTFVLSKGCYEDYFSRAVKCRNMLRAEFSRAFEKYDIIAGLTSPDTAFKKGQNVSPVEAYLTDEFTAPANLAGLPAISVPFGYDEKNLPIGIQLIADRFHDGRLLSAAKCIERLTGAERADIAYDFKEDRE